MAALFLDDLDACEVSALPGDVEFVVGRIDVHDDAMTPAESAQYQGARRADFSSGRRAALAALSRAGYPARIERDDRRPIWPRGAVGSITHAAGLAIAVVAPTASYRAVGIDLEAMDAVSDRVAARVATVNETPPCDGAYALVFSAKEAIYKAVNPLVGEYLPFKAVELSWNMNDGSFAARTLKDRPSTETIAAGRGRFQSFMGCWLTAFVIADC